MGNVFKHVLLAIRRITTTGEIAVVFVGNLGRMDNSPKHGLTESQKSFPGIFPVRFWWDSHYIKLMKCLSAVKLHVAIPMQVPDTIKFSTAQYWEFLSLSCQ